MMIINLLKVDAQPGPRAKAERMKYHPRTSIQYVGGTDIVFVECPRTF